ncbi:hypothetical protein ACFLSE_06170 [Bacteroidota bacterium]
MKIYFFEINDRPKYEIAALSIIIQLYLFRTSIPVFKYLFVPLFIVFFIYLILLKKKEFFKSVKNFMKNYFIIFILYGVYILAYLFSIKLYLIVLKDIVNAALLILLFLSLTVVIKNKKELNQFIATFIKVLLFFGLLISIVRLSGLLVIYKIEPGAYLKIDKNFVLLPIFYALISILYLFYTKLSKIKISLFAIIMLIFSLNIILSGSRRGLLVFMIILLILISMQFLHFFIKLNILRNFIVNSRVFLISFLIMSILSGFFLFNASCSFKNNMLEFIGSKDKKLAKINISVSIKNCISVLDRDLNYNELHKKIWYSKMSSVDPDCNWGGGDCIKVFPLTGENHEIVPPDAIGCLIELSSIDSLNEAWRTKYIEQIKVNQNESYRASIYCYVSNDFSQNGVSIVASWGSSSITDESRKKAIDRYDMRNIGKWQELVIEFDCNTGFVPIIVYINNWGNEDIYPMHGNIIFAYPQIELIHKDDSIIGVNNSKYVNYRDNRRDMILAMEEIVESRKFYIDSFNMHTNCLTNELNINKANLFSLPLSMVTAILQLKEKDSLKNWVATLISEDTTYYGNKNELGIDTIYNKFSGPRIVRWRFAGEIFTKEYNWKQKLFGGGFSFLNWYGYYFKQDKTKIDWPHNPFLHILLYSGILGLSLYVFFMYKVFYYYIKYIKEYYLFFIFFLITFFFTFFSGGSPFDPPMVGFFSIFPFFIHSVKMKEKSEAENE